MTGEPNIGRWLEHHAVFRADSPAITFEDGTVTTYGGLDRWAGSTASYLSSELGVGRGDRVGYLGFNTPDMMALLFACSRLGAILVPMNWRLTPAELGFIAGDCAPKALFHDEDHTAPAAAAARQASRCPALPLTDISPERPAPGDAIDAGRLDDPLLIVYTSGTTGRPKGAVLPQRALMVNALNSIDMHGLSHGDTLLVALPLFHVGGLNIQFTPSLYAGAHVHLHGKFDPAAVLDAIEAARPDLMVLVPATMQALMAQPRWADADLSSLRMITTGSTIVPVDLITAYEARGLPVVQVYGSTETCPIAAYQRPGEGRTNPSSTGKAALLSALKVIDRDGKEIAQPGMEGEIAVKGDHVMTGYWNNEEATRAVLSGGWFRTGDVGALDDDGNLYFRDRLSNVIISGGENIYPAEIDRVLRLVTGVEEAAIVGVADEKWGEVPVAAVVCPDGPVPEAAIRAILDIELARFKHPKHIVVVDALPRNAMGKVMMDGVREIVQAELSGTSRH